MDNNQTLDISWGDPREPYIKNGMQAFWVVYKAEKLAHHFTVEPEKIGENAFRLVVFPPLSAVKAFGRKDEFLSICNLVLEYLKNCDLSSQWRMKGKKCTEISLDLSRLPSRISMLKKDLKEKYRRPLMYLPVSNQLLIILFGFLSVFLHQAEAIQFNQTYLAAFFFYLGGFSLFLLLKDILKVYKLSLIPLFIQYRVSKNINPRTAAIKIIIKGWGVRYAITLASALFFLIYAKVYV